MGVKDIALPPPSLEGGDKLERLLQRRRTVREFRPGTVSLRDIGQLLWAAQGVTHPEGLRTAPSAGALYPLELYLLAGETEGLSPGLYRYRSDGHRLIRLAPADLRKDLAEAALEQTWLAHAGIVVVVTAVYERTTRKYGDRGVRYVHMDAAFAAENLFLQAESLGLGAAVVGAFEDGRVAELLQLPEDVKPLLLLPVGKK
ncbi:MAG: SagB/ThcOx family dehydrogenase [Gammaproteobacteria bacterium]